MMSIFYIFLAILGLGFLVFIHELGHYFVALKVGMKVEAFSIGFGKPIVSWMRKGVKWQIGWLPFGGYVRIPGMQKEGDKEPHQIKGGFYAKRPLDRIKVAIMGPLVNLVFAFIAFSLIWAFGGREKDFSHFTKKIGWVETNSPLYEKGITPGDEILSYGGKPYEGFQDYLMSFALNGSEKVKVEGERIDYYEGKKSPFSYTLPTYEDEKTFQIPIRSVGLAAPAGYVVYKKYQRQDNPLVKNSPLASTGISYGDRIVWVNGELIFSLQQLRALINDVSAYLTIQRGEEIFQTRVPRAKVEDLYLSKHEKAELDDWQHEAGIHGNLASLYFIPYLLNAEGKVENFIKFISEASEQKAYALCHNCRALRSGDKIIAVNGKPISDSYALLKDLQEQKALILLQKSPLLKPVSWKEADHYFYSNLSFPDLEKITSTIGTTGFISEIKDLRLLSPVIPQPLSSLGGSSEEKVLGIALQDQQVLYNPNPFNLFVGVFREIWKTFSSLLTGRVSPKYLVGPVGIVQVVHVSWQVGAKEALYWLGAISLNLGVLNLLPIPVLDGGHILFSLFEMVTKRRIKSKTMERLVLPFLGLLVLGFVYITYHDLSRLFHRIFQ